MNISKLSETSTALTGFTKHPQSVQKDSPSSSYFESLIHTPSKQNSGDEYYWQHQDQLQKSSLRFDAVITAKQHQIESPLRQDGINNTVSVASILPKEGQNVETIQAKAALENKLMATSQLQMPTNTTQQDRLSAKAIFDEPISKPLQSREKPLIKTENPSTYEPTHNEELKKHHLFISEKEAELSLNTTELETQEEKELIPILKNYFKRKGFSLKQLIINGVHHD